MSTLTKAAMQRQVHFAYSATTRTGGGRRITQASMLHQVYLAAASTASWAAHAASSYDDPQLGARRTKEMHDIAATCARAKHMHELACTSAHAAKTDRAV